MLQDNVAVRSKKFWWEPQLDIEAHVIKRGVYMPWSYRLGRVATPGYMPNSWVTTRERASEIKANSFTPNTKDEDITLATLKRNRGEKHTDPNALQSPLKMRRQSRSISLRRNSPNAASETTDCSCQWVLALNSCILTIAAGRYGDPLLTGIH